MKNTIIMLIVSMISTTNLPSPVIAIEELNILKSNDLTARKKQMQEYLKHYFSRSYYNADLKRIDDDIFEMAKETPEYTSYNQTEEKYKTVHNEMLTNNCFNNNNCNTPDCKRLKELYDQADEEQKKSEEAFQKTPEMQAKLKIQQCIESNQRIQKIIEEEQKEQRKLLLSLLTE